MVKRYISLVFPRFILPLDEQKSRLQALDHWFLSDQGQHVAKTFLAELQSIESLFYGENLIQLGNCGNNIFFSVGRFQYRWITTPHQSPSAKLITLMNQLPLDRHSVDCIIAPLTLEALSHDKSPLDEIDRILKPMGYVVFFGINPISLWGLWLRAAKNTCFASHHSSAKSVLSLKRGMLHRGYVQRHLSTFYYLPPVNNKKLREQLQIFNELGKMISPVPAGFYCLVVQKYQENPIGLIPKFPILSSFINVSTTPLQPVCRKVDG